MLEFAVRFRDDYGLSTHALAKQAWRVLRSGVWGVGRRLKQGKRKHRRSRTPSMTKKKRNPDRTRAA